MVEPRLARARSRRCLRPAGLNRCHVQSRRQWARRPLCDPRLRRPRFRTMPPPLARRLPTPRPHRRAPSGTRRNQLRRPTPTLHRRAASGTRRNQLRRPTPTLHRRAPSRTHRTPSSRALSPKALLRRCREAAACASTCWRKRPRRAGALSRRRELLQAHWTRSADATIKSETTILTCWGTPRDRRRPR